jgi:hypothetical protein
MAKAAKSRMGAQVPIRSKPSNRRPPSAHASIDSRQRPSDDLQLHTFADQVRLLPPDHTLSESVLVPDGTRHKKDRGLHKVGFRWLAHDASKGANKFTSKDADRLDALLAGAHAADPALAHREVVLVLGPGHTIDTRVVVPRLRASNVRITGAEQMAELEGIAEKMLVD